MKWIFMGMTNIFWLMEILEGRYTILQESSHLTKAMMHSPLIFNRLDDPGCELVQIVHPWPSMCHHLMAISIQITTLLPTSIHTIDFAPKELIVTPKCPHICYRGRDCFLKAISPKCIMMLCEDLFFSAWSNLVLPGGKCCLHRLQKGLNGHKTMLWDQYGGNDRKRAFPVIGLSFSNRKQSHDPVFGEYLKASRQKITALPSKVIIISLEWRSTP